jgi:glycosyltransferase involved in cell wall biosynthesis
VILLADQNRRPPPDRRTVRIALAGTSRYDFLDPRSWSGLPRSIYSAMAQRDDVETVLMGPVPHPRRYPESVRKGFAQLRGQNYVWWREPRILRHYHRQFEKLLDAYRPDVVVAMGGDTAAALPASATSVLYADATWDANVDYYETWSNMTTRSRRTGEVSEQWAFDHIDHAVLTSDWAASSAVEHYGFSADAITVQPLGGAHVATAADEELAGFAAGRLDGPIKLLWVGVEWERKGGDIAIAITRALRERGEAVELHLAGRYPDEVGAEPGVVSHGFLDPDADSAELARLFAEAFAFLLPARAEDSAMVLSEAASWGVPGLASRTGGLPTSVADGVSGLLFDVDATPEAYADAIVALRNDPERYLSLCGTSRERYQTEMNWDVCVERIVEVSRTLVG